MKRNIRVVAAIIKDQNNKILITQRKPSAFMPLKWEFPGGKVEPGESDPEALKREIKEELAVDIEVSDEFMSLVYPYPDFDVDFHVYNCRITGGSIKKQNVHDYRWVDVIELEKFRFPPADEPTVKRLLEEK